MIDLHVHTTCSDGTDSPAELVLAADDLGLAAVAICDHDTAAAYEDPAVATARTVITGIEVSVQFGPGTFHLLGYHIDPQHPAIRSFTAQLQAWRHERNLEMVERMAGLGLPVTMPALEAIAAGGVVGRPHMAQWLVEQGFAASLRDAFGRYLASGGPCYVPKRKVTEAEAIELVHAAGGAAVLAHPIQLRLDLDGTAAVVRRARDLGLDGLEAWHSDHSPELAERYRRLAAELGLVVTAGSDYHGDRKPTVQLGVIPGDIPPDEAILEPLAAAAARRR